MTGRLSEPSLLDLQHDPPREAAVPQRLPHLSFAVWFPLVVYMATRLIDALLILIASRHQIALSGLIDGYHVTLPSPAAPGYSTVASNWDGQWYLGIATHGYPSIIPRDAAGHVVQNAWGFYPAYPFLVGALMRVTGLGFTVAAPILSLLLGGAAVIVMFRLVNQTAGRFAASATVVLVSASMAAPVMQIAYTESLALLLLCTALLLLRNRHYGWLIPILMTLALTRAIALAFVPILVVHYISRYRRRLLEPFPRVDRWRVAGVACLAVAVTGLWPAIAGITTHDPVAYTQTMASWGGTTGKLQVLIAFPAFAWAKFGVLGLAVLLCIITMTSAIALRRQASAWGPEVRAWAGFYPIYLLLATSAGSSNIRHLFLAFPLMWPFPEEANSRSDRIRRIVMVAFLAIIGLLMQWVWISKFLVVAGPPETRPFP